MPYNYLQIEKKLKKLGYKKIRQKGSHVLFSNGTTTFPVPNHAGKIISQGVEQKIYLLTGINKETFCKI